MNKSFMDMIYETECRFKKYIMNYHDQPLIVLGGGVGAKSIVQYLKKSNIKKFHVCVDKEYWQCNKYTEGYPIENIEKVLTDNPDKQFDIIVAFYVSHKTTMDFYKSKYGKSIANVIYEDIIPHFWMEPQIFTIDRSFYESHNEELTNLYNVLADDHSRKVLRSFIEQRISGNFMYSEGLLSQEENEYFEPEIFNFQSDITLIDCGAYDGEDTKRFFKIVSNNNCFSYIIEPDQNNLELIRKNLQDNSDCFIIINKAIWDSETELTFQEGGGEGSGINDNGNNTISTISVDKLYDSDSERFSNTHTLIKMDIEGAELKAIQGAERFISEQHPFLAICVYHKPEDIFEIAKKILDINKEYKLYLRRYCCGFRDTVLYAM